MEDVAVAVKVTAPVRMDGLIEDVNEEEPDTFPTVSVVLPVFVV
jgi:hypothetical protein